MRQSVAAGQIEKTNSSHIKGRVLLLLLLLFVQGYMPDQLYDLSSAYGSQQQLKECVAALTAAGIGSIADVVINHRWGPGLALGLQTSMSAIRSMGIVAYLVILSYLVSSVTSSIVLLMTLGCQPRPYIAPAALVMPACYDRGHASMHTHTRHFDPAPDDLGVLLLLQVC